MQTELDYTKSEQYNLSIRLTPDGFSFYVVDSAVEGMADYVSFQFKKNQSVLTQIEELFYQNERLLLPYKRTDIVVLTPDYTVVPNTLMIDKREADLLNMMHPDGEGKVLTNKLGRISATNIFRMNQDVYSFLMRTLTVNRLIHYITPLTEYFTERSKFGNYSKLYVNIGINHLDIFCYHRNKLNMVNSHAYVTISDAAYFVLAAWEKHQLHQLDDELHVCGNPSLRKDLMPLLSKYVERVLPLNPPSGWFVVPVNKIVLPMELKTISLCE